MNTTETQGKAAAEAPRERPWILMLDDDADFQLVLRRLLQIRYDTVSLPHGEEFFHAVSTMLPDLIILDVEMPGADGYTLCRRLKAIERFRQIPVLFLTGKRTDEDFLDHLDTGGNAFLTKPFDEDELLFTIERLLEKY
jgi:CheY-like chemotaxis protein